MNLVMQSVICLFAAASVTACSAGRSQRTLPVAGPGEYAFALAAPTAGQTVTTSWSQGVARSLKDGTGQMRTDESNALIQCSHRLVATSGAAITKMDLACKYPGMTNTLDNAAGYLTGTWSLTEGMAIEDSNLQWTEKSEARRAVLTLSASALESLFGGLWKPGAQRQINSLAFWQLLSPELYAAPGNVTFGLLTFVGLAGELATFSFTGEVRYDELNVQVKGTVVLDAASGWPAKVTLDAESAQDMAHIIYKLEKTVAIQP